MSTALPLQHRCSACGEWWATVHCCPKQMPSLMPPKIKDAHNRYETVQMIVAERNRLRAEVDALKLQRTSAELVHRETATTVLMQAAEVEALRADADAVAALLPGPYYMDPPDGGSVMVIEQLRRMAADAARYRWLRARPLDCDEIYVAVDSDKYPNRWGLHAAELDAAIDAARSAQGGEHG